MSRLAQKTEGGVMATKDSCPWNVKTGDRDCVRERWIVFLKAYDIWASSEEHCGGRKFDTMLEARDKIEEALAGVWK